MRNFREYEIWKSAIAIAGQVYELTARFPSSEKYGLSSQLQRAVVSISSNIAEGCSRQSEADFGRFLEISLGSAFEVESQLVLAEYLNISTQEQVQPVISSIQPLQKQIATLINKILKN